MGILPIALTVKGCKCGGRKRRRRERKKKSRSWRRKKEGGGDTGGGKGLQNTERRGKESLLREGRDRGRS